MEKEYYKRSPYVISIFSFTFRFKKVVKLTNDIIYLISTFFTEKNKYFLRVLFLIKVEMIPDFSMSIFLRRNIFFTLKRIKNLQLKILLSNNPETWQLCIRIIWRKIQL